MTKEKLIEEINKEISDINSVCEKLKQKIEIAFSATVAIYNPIVEYVNLKKTIKEFIELKAKIIMKDEKTKDKYIVKEIIEQLNKE